MYSNKSHDECPNEQLFFNAIFSEAQKLMVILTRESARQLHWHILTEYILFKKPPKLKNAHEHAVVSGHCFELNSPSLHQCYIKRSVEFTFVFNADYIQTSLPFEKGGMGKEQQEGIDKGFLIAMEEKKVMKSNMKGVLCPLCTRFHHT